MTSSVPHASAAARPVRSPKGIGGSLAARRGPEDPRATLCAQSGAHGAAVRPVGM